MLFKSSRAAQRRLAMRMLFAAYPLRTSVVLSLATASAAFGAGVVVVSGALIDAVRGLSADSLGGVRLLVAALAGLTIAGEGAGSIRHVAGTVLYRRFDEHVRARVMTAVLRPSGIAHLEDARLADRTAMARGVDRFGPGELVSGLTTKWGARSVGVFAFALVASVHAVAAVGLAAVWLVVGRQVVVANYRATPFWTHPLRRAETLRNLQLSARSGKEIRIFGLRGWLLDRFDGEWRQVMEVLWSARRGDHVAMAALGLVLLVANAVAVLVVARAAASPGEVAVAAQALFGMSALASLDGDTWIENGAVPLPDVVALESATPAPPAGGRDSAGLPRASIAFEDVWFSYPGREVLRGLDLRIAAGHSIGLVGLNGAGKTTLTKLLAGLYQPDRGRVSIDGIDLGDLNIEAWRRRLAVIFQDFIHYELPVAENIGYGAIEQFRAGEPAETAARRAGALPVIERLADGWDTMLSVRFGGVELSGGEWQRIALARAFYAVDAGAGVLVLDEPTAHLDVRAEAELFDRFLELTPGLTTILITHRLSSVRHADRIVLVGGGRIIEDGSHEELMVAGGSYAEMFRMQAERFDD